MAKKKPDMTDIFAKTEAAQEEKADPVSPRGIGLRKSEWERLDRIGAEMGSNAHALAAWAIRDFLRRYEAGELPTQTRPTLPGL